MAIDNVITSLSGLYFLSRRFYITNFIPYPPVLAKDAWLLNRPSHMYSTSQGTDPT